MRGVAFVLLCFACTSSVFFTPETFSQDAAEQRDGAAAKKPMERDLLAELDDEFKKAVEMDRARLRVLEAASLLEATNQSSRWTNYMSGSKLLRQARSKAAIPLLLKYMYIHTEMKGTGGGAVKEYVDTLSILTGIDIPNPYRHQADRVTATRESVKKLFDTWWKPKKDKIATDMDSFTSEQIGVVVDKLLKRNRSHYARYLREAREEGKSVTASLMSHMIYGKMLGQSSDRPDWLKEEIHPAMIPHLLARSGYEEKPVAQPRRELNPIGFDVIDMLAWLRKNGEAEELDEIASDARQNSAVRLTCILSLYAAGERLMSDDLLSILAKEKNGERRLATILALRYGRDVEKIVPVLVKQLDDKDFEIATAAACALQDARPPEALPKMLELINDRGGQAAILVFRI
ncbi:MAG: HEAT repeat domain-containing protein, partial [Planctomycetes bacterium]|nr:HEAT repeat domain-containing protein [Planctomycetota bacterium]